MKTKLSFLIVAISVCMSALAVEVPAKLFVRGTALAESSVAMEMKRINEDFPKFYMGEGSISNTYELFTALKTGSYEFATSADGGALIQAATITVDGGESLVPYRIRVNFDEATPVVAVLKVDEVILWAPSKKYVITNLEYVGNSTFYNDYVEYIKADWGDERYRIRVYTEDGEYTTYGYKLRAVSAPDNDSNEDEKLPGYFDLYTTTNIEGWDETIDGEKFYGSEYKLSVKRRTANPLLPFSVKVIFSTSKNYTHELRDYDPTSIRENKMQNVNIYPTIIDNSTTVSVAEGAFSVEFVSITGVSVLKVNSSGNVLNLEGLDMASGMYLVKIVQDNNVLSVKRVIKL